MSFKELEQSKLLGSQTTENQGTSGDGGNGSSSRGEDEATGRGEGGGGDGVQEDNWLSHAHAEQADGESDSEQALGGDELVKLETIL